MVSSVPPPMNYFPCRLDEIHSRYIDWQLIIFKLNEDETFPVRPPLEPPPAGVQPAGDQPAGEDIDDEDEDRLAEKGKSCDPVNVKIRIRELHEKSKERNHIYP